MSREALLVHHRPHGSHARFRRRHRAGRLLALGLAIVAMAGFVVLVLIGLDLALAFESQARDPAFKIAGSLIARGTVVSFLAAVRLSRSQ